MITYSEEVIKQKCYNLWQSNAEKLSIEVKVNKADLVEIGLASMYSPPGLSFTILKGLSVFFDTDNINDDDAFSMSGCETCDYGSSYGFTLRIRP